MNKLGLTPEQSREFKLHSAALYPADWYHSTSTDDPPFAVGTDSGQGLQFLIPDVPIAKTASHRIVLNSKGEIEVVSAMGEIQNLGKEIR